MAPFPGCRGTSLRTRLSLPGDWKPAAKKSASPKIRRNAGVSVTHASRVTARHKPITGPL